MTTTERAALDRINRRQNAANLFTNITPADIANEIKTMKEEADTMNAIPNLATVPAAAVKTATPAQAAIVRAIIRRHGENRERAIMDTPHTMERGETWNDAHKVIEVLEAVEGPDGYRAGFAVDIVTRSIVG